MVNETADGIYVIIKKIMICFVNVNPGICRGRSELCGTEMLFGPARSDSSCNLHLKDHELDGEEHDVVDRNGCLQHPSGNGLEWNSAYVKYVRDITETVNNNRKEKSG